MKVNVLGVKYKITKSVKESDNPKIKGCDGFCDFTTKEIFVAELIENDDTMADLTVYEERVIRHELVHAFLFESGLDHNTEWARNEEIVDWIALQFPKMAKVFEQLEISQ